MSNYNNISLEQVRSQNDVKNRKTKIICTLGPACWSVEGLGALIDAGMNTARFNFSHGDHATHLATLTRLREAIASRPNCHCAVLLDTKGPEIRTGVVDPAHGPKLKFTKDATIEVGTDYSKPCTPDYLACSYKSLPKSVKVGGKILVADGSLMLEVLEIKSTSVIAKILNNASIGDKKNMNLPGAIVDLPTLTDKDKDDLKNWGVKHGVDFIAASFVRKGSDIDIIRETLGPEGAHIKIISKIENQEGLENYDDILAKSDGIMVARGDLGMEIPLEKVFLAQKMMIGKANLAGKPVVTATQMLESMITNPRPTRAEAADVANAVLDGTDVVMLSGETANGDFPAEAVAMMRNTCVEAENIIDYESKYRSIRQGMFDKFPGAAWESTESVASSAVKTAKDTNAAAIIVLTDTGNSARLTAKYRPSTKIYAVTSNKDVGRQMAGYMSNVNTIIYPDLSNTSKIVEDTIKDLVERNEISMGDAVVMISGTKHLSGSTDTMQLHYA